MTHTLHRFGRYEDLADDFIVTAMPARGFNDKNAVPKQKQFLQTALKYKPVNIGNSIKGAQHRSSRHLNPAVPVVPRAGRELLAGCRNLDQGDEREGLQHGT